MKGSYYKRGKTWSFMIDIGKDPKTGERNQLGRGGFKTKKDAQAAAAEILAEVNRGTYVKETKMTFEELSEQWLKHYSKHGKPKKDGTIRIRSNERDNLLTCFAKVIASEITPGDYQAALNSLKEHGGVKKRGLGENTLSGIHSTAGMIFEYGVKIGAVKIDPTESAYIPQGCKNCRGTRREQ
ncbi:Arm DNA-binding domain-containing protein [Paenibacillus melissococcoides]|uniref:Arm DNA-binding domain-containing protein n=1 Tax=Paenibacillus melissococcoides TaxID=2912268 RepID=A0ABM9GCM2_9BACL|nr:MULTISPECIES: Arm DNA-binding domain-containing protein [Paenibacillus]MEB9893830.1 Arm DNA-binding domain-containing protein [Bacillus cereus]CAH8249437.1 Arm DNA-binding domain-containing protein [Paenibacillus melissococcoides]CAH8721114.1 Arm DNA-binding domain-containing protein [Paenibacillus melissococcoides]CAH8721446.1 Arm DNA-binding domain-containing protein [Paenibacillus melissococcoides]GIO79893.1 hypothetical protein J6TS7_35030 [Paenibacillus dendritiformis]